MITNFINKNVLHDFTVSNFFKVSKLTNIDVSLHIKLLIVFIKDMFNDFYEGY